MNKLLLSAGLALAVALPALAQHKPGDHASHGGAASASASAGLSVGEIRKIDKKSRKITLKHGEIKNLEMPAMTMVFEVKDAAWLGRFKPGDAVHFRAEKAANGNLVVTELVAAK